MTKRPPSKGGLLSNVSVTGLSCLGGIAAVYLYPDTSKSIYYLYYLLGTVVGGIVGYALSLGVRHIEEGPGFYGYRDFFGGSLVCGALMLLIINGFVITDIAYLYGAIIPAQIVMGCIAVSTF
jgi:hypothetical protein